MHTHAHERVRGRTCMRTRVANPPRDVSSAAPTAIALTCVPKRPGALSSLRSDALIANFMSAFDVRVFARVCACEQSLRR